MIHRSRPACNVMRALAQATIVDTERNERLIRRLLPTGLPNGPPNRQALTRPKPAEPRPGGGLAALRANRLTGSCFLRVRPLDDEGGDCNDRDRDQPRRQQP